MHIFSAARRALPLLLLASLVPLSAAAEGAPPPRRPSVAVVLSGGGAKGFAHIPVLELIQETGIPIDLVIGNSAGAIVGGLFCAGYSPAELRALLTQVNWTAVFQDTPRSPLEDFLGAHSVFAKPLRLRMGSNFSPDFGAGFSSGQEAYRLFKTLTAKVPSYIDFDSLPIPFRAVAVNAADGEMSVFGSGDLAEAIRASMSIPAVFAPFYIDGAPYMDGVLRNNTPIQQAKDLGFDIIIAVELPSAASGELPEGQESAMFIPQVLNIVMNAESEKQQALADVVLNVDMRGYTMFDFPRAVEIYNRGVEECARFREPLARLREKIFPGSKEAARNAGEGAGRNAGDAGEEAEGDAGRPFVFVGDDRPEEGGESVYAALPYITAGRLSVRGAAPQDEPFLRALFNRTVSGKKLTPERLSAFLQAVYKTGNYSQAAARIDERITPALLDVRLRARSGKSAMVLAGIEFQSTLASSSVNKMTVGIDAQARGLTGPGSVLALSGSLVNRTGAELLLFQPVNRRAYAAIKAGVLYDQDLITAGFAAHDMEGSRITTAGASFDIGVVFGAHHSLTAGPGIVWMNTREGFTEALARADRDNADARIPVAAPFTLAYTFTTLNYPALPTAGFRAAVTNTAVLPVADEGVFAAYNIASADFTAAVPLSARFSLEASLFAGTDASGNLKDVPYQIPVFGFNTFDRKFFPHSAGKEMYGAHKGAARLALLFTPWDNVTILGGQVIFSAQAGAGEVAMTYEDFSAENAYWHGAFSAGARINKAFGIRLTAGAGARGAAVTPFIALDIGTML